jgi:hypothetical protein
LSFPELRNKSEVLAGIPAASKMEAASIASSFGLARWLAIAAALRRHFNNAFAW